jgi:deazaflavin-dependent oxidoreductase (nitroreductase family)
MLLRMQPLTRERARSAAETEAIRRLLARGGLIDITTTGRRSGRPRRLEIVFHNIDGRIVISGQPSRRTRGWIHNLVADPRLTVHVKGALSADLPATARVITDPTERRAIAEWIVQNAWRRMDPESMTTYSPMIEVTLDQPL